MRRTLPLLFTLALALVPAPVAQGRSATSQDLLRECSQTGQVSNPLAWSRAQYEQAIAHVPADVAEYTQCVSVLQRAELARAGNAAGAGPAPGAGGGAGGGGSAGAAIGPIGVGGSGGGGPRSGAELASLRHAMGASYVPPTAGGGPLLPLLHVDPASQRHGLPSSLLALLVLLGAVSLVAITPLLLRRVRPRRQR